MSNQSVVERVSLRREFSVRLARALHASGLSKGDERVLRRQLEKGVDYCEVGHEVRYAPSGVERLMNLISEGAKNLGSGIAERGSEKLKIGGLETERKNGEGMRQDAPRRAIAGLLTEVAGVSGPLLVRVMRAAFANSQVVEIALENLGSEKGESNGARGDARPPIHVERFMMRVRSSENFLPGMLCWGRPVLGQGAWEFCGRGDRPPTTETGLCPVCPRGRGRW